MATSFVFSVGDTANDKVSLPRLSSEIRASAIGAALDRIDQVGSTFTVIFKADLSAGDETILDALVAAHTGGPLSAPAEVVVEERIGGYGTVVTGLGISGGPSATHKAELTMLCAAHLQGAFLLFDGFDLDDRGHLALINPAGDSSLQAAADEGATEISVEAAKAPYYAPANGAAQVEFWDDDALVEQQPLASVSGSTVTLGAPLSQALASGIVTRVRIGGYTPVSGDDGLAGGVRLLGAGQLVIKNEFGVSEEIPQGMVVAGRIKTSSAEGTRKLALDYIFRTNCGH